MGEIKEFFDKILEKLYPSDITCIFCGEEVSDGENCLCDKCEKDAPWNAQYCFKCGSPIYSLAKYCMSCKNIKRNFDIARAPLIYKDKVAVAIQNLKYNGKKYLSKPLAKLMKRSYQEIKNKTENIDFLIPVPLFKERQKKRGFNQSELLANELSKLINVSVMANNLIRIKNTETQTNLSFQERQDNLEGAFQIQDKSLLKGKNIVLIDDVLTTGSTVDHCAIALKKAKVKSIFVLTVATTDNESL